MDVAISIASVFALGDLSQYKLHLANWDGTHHPIDVFAESFDAWVGWNRYRGTREVFSRPKIFSLIRTKRFDSTWLFGGVFQIVARHSDHNEVRLCEDSAGLVGRLIVDFATPGLRGRAFFLERYYEQMTVSEILSKRYEGIEFDGYDRISLSFRELEALIRAGAERWKSALQFAKGVYLITDRMTGKGYVGSAYGDSGIWSRWSSYVYSGHGSNVELRELLDGRGFEYARMHFQFSLLEHILPSASDQYVIERENFWKRALMTREFGLNSN